MKTESFKLPDEKSNPKLIRPVDTLMEHLMIVGIVLGSSFVIYQLLKKKKKHKKQVSVSAPKQKTQRMTTSQFINSMTMILLEMAHEKLRSYAANESESNSKTP